MIPTESQTCAGGKTSAQLRFRFFFALTLTHRCSAHAETRENPESKRRRIGIQAWTHLPDSKTFPRPKNIHKRRPPIAGLPIPAMATESRRASVPPNARASPQRLLLLLLLPLLLLLLPQLLPQLPAATGYLLLTCCCRCSSAAAAASCCCCYQQIQLPMPALPPTEPRAADSHARAR